MARLPIQIGDRTFPYKKDALAFFKEMLSRYRDRQTVEGEDAELLFSLIERHPEAVQKIGVGIKRFYRFPAEFTSCFWLERHDGTKTDFSYISAANAKAPSLYQEFAEACRCAVKVDLETSKNEHFRQHADESGRVPCDITGELIAKHESHLDHKKPMTFQVMVRTFIAAHGIEISREMLTAPADAQFQTEFVDLELRGKFVDYHRRAADLRIIGTKQNLSLGGSERILKSRNPVVIKVGRA